jgi:hypothetical protein
MRGSKALLKATIGQQSPSMQLEVVLPVEQVQFFLASLSCLEFSARLRTQLFVRAAAKRRISRLVMHGDRRRWAGILAHSGTRR